MRKFILTTIIAFLAISLGLYAQVKDSAQTEPQVKLKVVYEKTFDEPIVDVIFDTAIVSIDEAKNMGWKEDAFTMEEKAKGKVLVSYPKVVFVSHGTPTSWYVPVMKNSYHLKELRFCDKSERLLRRLRTVKKKDGAEYIYLSPQKKCILVSRIPTEWAPAYSGGTLYDLEGKRIWEINGPTPIAVSDEGYAIGAYLDWDVPPKVGGDFYVYDSKGKLISTIENPLKEKTAPLFAKYSKDGDYAILSFKATTYPPTVFVLITKDGKILWEKELLEYRFPGRYEEIDILPTKGIAGIIDKGGLYPFALSWDGDLSWVIPSNPLSNAWCMFSQDGSRVYVASAKGYLLCLHERNGETIWMQKRNKAFSEMYDMNQHIVVKDEGSKWCVFDSETGKLKAEIEYPEQIFLSPHNGRIFVIDVTNKKIEGFKIEEE